VSPHYKASGEKKDENEMRRRDIPCFSGKLDLLSSSTKYSTSEMYTSSVEEQTGRKVALLEHRIECNRIGSAERREERRKEERKEKTRGVKPPQQKGIVGERSSEEAPAESLVK
jgi:hypothetical protein